MATNPVIERLLEEGKLKQAPPDLAWAKRASARAEQDLNWARLKLEGDEPDFASASSDAWTAALHGLLAVLRITGYRITSKAGHHVAALDAVEALLPKDWAPTIRNLRWLSKQRNQSLYELLSAGGQDVYDALNDVDRLLSKLREGLSTAETASPTDATNPPKKPQATRSSPQKQPGNRRKGGHGE